MIVKNNPRFSILDHTIGISTNQIMRKYIGLWILTITLRISTGIVRLRWRLGVILGNGTICSTILSAKYLNILYDISDRLGWNLYYAFIYSHLHVLTRRHLSFCLLFFMKFTHSLKFLQKLQNWRWRIFLWWCWNISWVINRNRAFHWTYIYWKLNLLLIYLFLNYCRIF